MPPRTHPPEIAPVSCVIVSWNSAHCLPGCLESLAAQSRRPAELIVVDNGSDGGGAAVAKGQPGVALIENKENRGFAAAVNQGWQRASEPWLFLLNPDVRLDPFYLSRLLLVLEARPRAGMGQGKLLRMDEAGRPLEPPVLDSAGMLWRRFGAYFIDRGGGEPDRGQYDEPGDIFGPCAAAALYRREMLEQISPPEGHILDEAFFAYVEDVDLAWRARRAGWEAFYEPSAVGWHQRGGSRLESPRLEQLLYRNRLWALAKNATGAELVRAAPGWLTYEGAKLAQALLTKPYLRPVVRERWRRWSEMRRKGRQEMGGSST